MASRSRIELQRKFEELLGSTNVYYQPPETVKMNYPCIRYSLSAPDTPKASNKIYTVNKCYSVTLICKDPDNELKDRLLEEFEYIKMDRPYTASGLNHYTYTLYY